MGLADLTMETSMRPLEMKYIALPCVPSYTALSSGKNRHKFMFMRKKTSSLELAFFSNVILLNRGRYNYALICFLRGSLRMLKNLGMSCCK